MWNIIGPGLRKLQIKTGYLHVRVDLGNFLLDLVAILTSHKQEESKGESKKVFSYIKVIFKKFHILKRTRYFYEAKVNFLILNQSQQCKLKKL